MAARRHFVQAPLFPTIISNIFEITLFVIVCCIMVDKKVAAVYIFLVKDEITYFRTHSAHFSTYKHTILP